jgi:hypothetical protein
MSNNEFYNSQKWRKLSKAFLQSKHYICERCGGAGEIAHHEIYLDRWNVRDPEISLNIAHLECLCLACHNAEHGGGGSATAAGISIDWDGNVVYTPPYSRQNMTESYTDTGDNFSSP